MTKPIRVLSFGAGVQSTTVLRMCLSGEIEPVDHVVFSDTGWEPRAVYEHLAEMRQLVDDAGVPFHQVSNGNLREAVLGDQTRFAGLPVHVRGLQGQQVIGRRQCTNEYKLKPVMAKQRELAGLKPRQRSNEVLMESVIGISLDEIQRMRDGLFPWIRNSYPLVDLRMTRHDCLEYHRVRDLPLPPRSSCIGCPYHSDREWRAVRDDPDAWADAVAFDEAIRQPPVSHMMFEGRAYLHHTRQPLSEVDLSSEEERGQGSLFDAECLGMCGL